MRTGGAKYGPTRNVNVSGRTTLQQWCASRWGLSGMWRTRCEAFARPESSATHASEMQILLKDESDRLTLVIRTACGRHPTSSFSQRSMRKNLRFQCVIASASRVTHEIKVFGVENAALRSQQPLVCCGWLGGMLCLFDMLICTVYFKWSVICCCLDVFTKVVIRTVAF